MELRPQNGTDFLLSGKSLTRAQILAGKESTHMLLADRVLPDLINAANLSGNPIAQQAAAKLAAWDRNADPQSKGAVLFEAWWAERGEGQYDQLLYAASCIPRQLVGLRSAEHAHRLGQSGGLGS